MYPFVHTKKTRPIYIFTVICVHLGVVILERDNKDWIIEYAAEYLLTMSYIGIG